MPILQRRLQCAVFAAAASLSLAPPTPAAAQKLPPIQYTVSMPAPETHLAHIQARIPTGAKPYVDLMMAVWSPGYYVQENYATHVQQLSAATPDGRALAVEQPQPNRWRVRTDGASTITLSYTLVCDHRSVTGDWVDTTMAILNGPATYITLVEHAKRRHDVALELPSRWKQSATSLTAASDSVANHYEASSYDELADSPIIAGIQHATNGKKSLDDMMRLAYKRYGGAHGFTPQQWVATASDVAGTDLTQFLHTLVQTTDEMDYSEALAWFGLRFAPSDNPATAWTLEIRPDATPQQTARLDRLTQPYKTRSRTVGLTPMMRERHANQGALKVLVPD